MYTYKRTEFSPFELYTVGTHDSGKWESESDHNTKEEAAKRVHYLNGGTNIQLLKALKEILQILRAGITNKKDQKEFDNSPVVKSALEAVQKAESE